MKIKTKSRKWSGTTYIQSSIIQPDSEAVACVQCIEKTTCVQLPLHLVHFIFQFNSIDVIIGFLPMCHIVKHFQQQQKTLTQIHKITFIQENGFSVISAQISRIKRKWMFRKSLTTVWVLSEFWFFFYIASSWEVHVSVGWISA